MTQKYLPLIICICIYLWLTPSHIFSQEVSFADLPQNIATGYIDGIYKKSEKLQHKINRYTARSLTRLKKLEEKIIKRLSVVDSAYAKIILDDARIQYMHIDQQLSQTQYNPIYESVLDTFSTSLKFLKQNNNLLPIGKLKLDEASFSLQSLDKSLQQTESIKRFLKQRQDAAKKYLSKSDLFGELKKINKSTAYYSQQIKEYKTILNDHRKAEKKALQLFSKSKMFQNFMQKNSILASLFRLPSSGESMASTINLEGLQTRNQVSQILQQQIGSGGSSGSQVIQANIQYAQQQLNILKNKLTKFGMDGNEKNAMPDYNVDNLKTKTLLKRLLYGINIQSQKASNYFPVTSELAASLGYKLKSKNVAGIAISYRFGAGNDFHHIRFTNEAIGFRTFFDYQLRGPWYASGGFEMNYMNAFDRIEELQVFNAWQQSGLLGVSKIIPIRNKIFKETKLQLLWDFLSYRQRPMSQWLRFRVGYNF